jgi:hypothetical protein
VAERVGHGEPFSGRRRIGHTAGATHHVLVVGDPIVDDVGIVVGIEGGSTST